MVKAGNREGGTYLCSWKKEGKGYRITVKGKAELTGSGATFAEARAALAECLLTSLGDGEPGFQFDGPLPKGVLPEDFSEPEILWIGGNDTALVGNLAELFEGGICGLCGNPAGKRNGTAARLTSLPMAKSDGAEAKHLGTLFSEAFVKLLAGSVGPSVEFREVQAEGKARKKMFEIAGSPLVDCVAVKGFPVEGVKCARCKRKVFHQMVGGELIPFLAKPDLPDPPPVRFVLRSRETLMLCMTGPAWRALQGRPGTTNLVAVQIGVAPAEDALRDPELPTFKG